jgi:hypothetical protein
VPEISRFLGIIVFMNFNEHNPPHFHVRYNEFLALIDIRTLGILEGKLPAKVHALIVEWAEIHQGELMENWESMKTTGGYKKIAPLV